MNSSHTLTFDCLRCRADVLPCRDDYKRQHDLEIFEDMLDTVPLLRALVPFLHGIDGAADASILGAFVRPSSFRFGVPHTAWQLAYLTLSFTEQIQTHANSGANADRHKIKSNIKTLVPTKILPDLLDGPLVLTWHAELSNDAARGFNSAVTARLLIPRGDRDLFDDDPAAYVLRHPMHRS